MIAHVSVPSRDPRGTALLLAALIDGEVFNFPVVPGAWIAVARDNSGLAIEVYPEEMAHHPGQGQVPSGHQSSSPQCMPWEDQIFPDGPQIRPTAFHLALATRLSEEQVLRLAAQARLRAIACDRADVFRVIEVWLDNAVLMEVLTPPEQQRYRQFMNPQGCVAMFGPGLLPAAA